MRLKEDTDSWRASSIVKRDFKHGNYKIPEQNLYHSHKDKVRWCKGKVGHEHVLHREVVGHHYRYTKVVCSNCRKEFYSNKKEKNVHLPLHAYIETDWAWYRIPVRLSDGTYKDLTL